VVRRYPMKKINQFIHEKSAIHIILSYVFYVLGRTLSRSQMSEINQTDGSILALASIMDQYSSFITAKEPIQLWETCIQILKECRHSQDKEVIYPYNELDDDQLMTIIRCQTSSLNTYSYREVAYHDFFQNIPLGSRSHTLILGYQVPMLAQSLSNSDNHIDVAVFDIEEWAVAMIHQQHLLNHMQVHLVKTKEDLEHLLQKRTSIVYINELPSAFENLPLFSYLYDTARKEVFNDRLSTPWVMIYALLYYYRVDEVYAFIDERDLRHRSFARARERLVKDQRVGFVASFLGDRYTSLNMIGCHKKSDNVTMISLTIEGGEINSEIETIPLTKIQKTQFTILTPFDYTSAIILENAIDLASIADIFSGHQVGLRRLREQAEWNKNVEVSMVSMPHLNKFGVLPPKDEYILEVGHHIVGRFEILENDILIASKSNDPKPTIVSNKPNNQIWIANSSIIVIRLKKTSKITPELLFAYLSSDKGLSQLKRLQRGNIVFITTKQIGDLLVEFIDETKVEIITRKVRSAITKYQHHFVELQRIESDLETALHQF
jgi:hypothetical protein